MTQKTAGSRTVAAGAPRYTSEPAHFSCLTVATVAASTVTVVTGDGTTSSEDETLRRQNRGAEASYANLKSHRPKVNLRTAAH